MDFQPGFTVYYLQTNESVEDEGTTGKTTASHLGALFTGELRFLKKQNLYFNTSVYTGWGYRKTAVNLEYPDYGINKDYEESYHALIFGLDSRIGYRLNNKLGAQFYIKNEILGQ